MPRYDLPFDLKIGDISNKYSWQGVRFSKIAELNSEFFGLISIWSERTLVRISKAKLSKWAKIREKDNLEKLHCFPLKLG